jgi:hypothetical protein
VIRRVMTGWGLARGSRLRRRRLIGGLLVIGIVACLGSASPALAGLKQEFSVFATCPYENPAVTQCIYSTTTGGEFKLGGKTVPVAPKVVVLKGGLTATSTELVPPTDGETLSKTPLTLPGGLVGIELGGPTEVTATAEVVGPINVNVPAEVSGEGTAVSMPLKVKLDNPALGNECFIGSAAEPVSLNLTTGTTSPPPPNTPITGNPGTVVITGVGKIGEVTGSSLVDNAFAAPGANGCNGGSAIVNLDAGLPSAAGKNTAILNGSFKQAAANVAKAVIALPEIGRCEKAPAEKEGKLTVYHGLYVNSTCTYEVPSRQGKFEWHPLTGPGKKFSTESKGLLLETHSKMKVRCLESLGSGEYTGAKSASFGPITLTGCETLPRKEVCTGAGAAAGEMKTGVLTGELGFVKDEPIPGGLVVSLGWALKSGSAIVEGECGPEKFALKVTGAVIAPISTISKMVAGYSLKFTQSGGKQIPESFEEEPTQALSLKFGAVTEQAGLSGAMKVTNQETLELKAVAE